jgi:hypothetical protein
MGDGARCVGRSRGGSCSENERERAREKRYPVHLRAYLGFPGMISTDDIQDMPGASFCGFWALTDSTQAKFL